MSNFSFSQSVFNPFRELSAIFIKFKIVVCKLFQFGRVSNLSFGKGLSHKRVAMLLYQYSSHRLHFLSLSQTSMFEEQVLKKYWEKENLPILSNFSFSHSIHDVFTLLENF